MTPVMRPRSRELFLHSTALSDEEYVVYVEAIHDILDEPENDGDSPSLTDDTLEARLVGMREVRVWMRGRYKDAGAGKIDKVCPTHKVEMDANSLFLEYCVG